MKYLKIIFSLIIFLMVVGCESETTISKLSHPENIEYNGILLWDEVNDATIYDVYVNEVSVTVDENMYIFEEEGIYTVYVIAKATGYLDSDASESINIEIDYENDLEFALTCLDDTLEWNVFEDVDNYNVFVNGVKHEVTTNSFVIDDLEAGVTSLSVQAVYPIGVSNISDVVYIANDLIETERISFQYSINSTMDIIIWEDITNDKLYLQNSISEFINKESLLVLSEEHLEIKSEYLVDLELGIFSFYLIHGVYKTLVEINITDNVNPYIISSTNIDTFGNTDVYLQYELFDGSFYSINGNKDDEVLHHFNNNIMVIEKEFIASKFAVNDMFVLSSVIKKDDTSVVGYLFINLIEE
jgi:hypothetical protein